MDKNFDIISKKIKNEIKNESKKRGGHFVEIKPGLFIGSYKAYCMVFSVTEIPEEIQNVLGVWGTAGAAAFRVYKEGVVTMLFDSMDKREETLHNALDICDEVQRVNEELQSDIAIDEKKEYN